MAKRTALFIDGEYFRFTLMREFNRARVNWEKLSSAMAGEAEILRTYYYNSLPYVGNPPVQDDLDRRDSVGKFFDRLRRYNRYKVRLGQTEFRGWENGRRRFEQKRVDILLAVDLVQLAAKGHIQEAVIVAGDSDFIPAIRAAQSEGVIVRLFYGDSCHEDLRLEVDERIRFDQAFINSVRE